MFGLGFNSNYEQLKLRRAALKERCATLFEMLAHLESVEAPSLKSEYMMRIGQLEHRVFELKTELKRWLQIQSAYDNQEWSKFRFLVSLIDDVVSEEKPFDSAQGGMALLEESVAALAERSAELSKRIADMEGREPFTYRSLLDNPKKVADRQAQLKAQIEALEKYAKEYEELWKHVK